MPRTVLPWYGSDIQLTFGIGGGEPVSLLSIRPAGAPEPPPGDLTGAPLVEVLALGHGRFPGSHRYAETVIGARLRYVTHTERPAGDQPAQLRIEQRDPESGLAVTSVFQASDGAPAVRAWTELRLTGAGSLRVEAVTSLATGAFLADSGRSLEELELLHGDSDWVAESRWHRTPLRQAGGLAVMDPAAHHHPSRGRFALTSRSSWSTGEHLPSGALVGQRGSWSLSWQIEHNGAWHWELGERQRGAYLALLGPTDTEHQWSAVVTAEEGFTSVPVSVAVTAEGGPDTVLAGPDAAFGALTRQRRALLHRPPAHLPVIFNDYMNTLMGNPTTAKLLPLISAAAAAGAEYFCIDAGWYDEGGRWWDSVGEWEPSSTRFPGGLGEVVDHIRAEGMVPGLWLEPEVIGVRSVMAQRLPDEAFFQRHGARVVEHGRYHLDLRHPAARAHVNVVVDRLVEEFGVGFFKFDYNIMPGPGTDLGGTAPGAGLLAHNRAHLEWLDALLARHPDLLIENCASGAMRMDYALLSRLHLQSTSDQQNPLLYPPIAAAAPASILPEQAGNWAYTQPEMTVEESAFTLATGTLSRLYLSGYLNRMTPDQLALVREAVTVHQSLRPEIARSLPFWPLGLTTPDGPWVAQGLRPSGELGKPGELGKSGELGDSYLTLWRRPGAPPRLQVPLEHLRGAEVSCEILFPTAVAAWSLEWDADAGVLWVTTAADGDQPTARVLRLRRS